MEKKNSKLVPTKMIIVVCLFELVRGHSYVIAK